MKSAVIDQLYELRTSLNCIDQQILAGFPETYYYQRIKALPRTAGYYFIPQDLRDNAEQIRSRYNQSTLSIYHRFILVYLIQASSFFLQSSKAYPEEIQSFYYRHFEWVFQNLIVKNSEDVNYYSYDNDLFLKDLGICSLRVFPIGSQVVELLGISRRFILDYGWKQLFQSSYFYLTKMKGNSPFYHVHLDIRWVNDFNQSGWHRFFQVLAEMLRKNPDVKGVFGSSWFYDPQLEKISPGLLFLRKIPELGGAGIFKWAGTDMDIENATCKSERRRRLYEEGQYLPISHVFIWPRNDLIKWADHFNEPLQRSQFNKSIINS